MSKIASLRNTDVGLMVTFPLTIGSGLFLHASGHTSNADAFQLWSDIHILAGILFLVFSIRHIVQHRIWFKTLISKIKTHSKITTLTALSYIMVAITGIFLMIGKEGVNPHLSIFHSQAGLLFSVFAGWHCLKRINVFISICKNFRGH